MIILYDEMKNIDNYKLVYQNKSIRDFGLADKGVRIKYRIYERIS